MYTDQLGWPFPSTSSRRNCTRRAGSTVLSKAPDATWKMLLGLIIGIKYIYIIRMKLFKGKIKTFCMLHITGVKCPDLSSGNEECEKALKWTLLSPKDYNEKE